MGTRLHRQRDGVKHIMLRKLDGAEALRRIQAHGVTYLCAAPAVVSALLDAAKTWEGQIPGHGRLRIICGGAPPPTRTIQRVRDELGWEFMQMYGLTETGPLLTLNRVRTEWDELDSFEQARLLGAAGVPVLGVQLKIGSEGEVLARSSRILESYWNDPQATAKAHEGDWFRTGDGGEPVKRVPLDQRPNQGHHRHWWRERRLRRGGERPWRLTRLFVMSRSSASRMRSGRAGDCAGGSRSRPAGELKQS